jgi:hypothetical protein
MKNDMMDEKLGKKWHHGWNFRENGYTMDEN